MINREHRGKASDLKIFQLTQLNPWYTQLSILLMVNR